MLAPNLRRRGEVTPAKRGTSAKRISNGEVRPTVEHNATMTWAQQLKRVFNIDIDVCGHRGGSVKVIACIEDRDIIDRILAHLREKEQGSPALSHLVRHSRAPPSHYRFSQEANLQPRISKDATEKRVARAIAHSRSGMNGYALRDHRSEQLFRAIGD